MCWGRGGEYLHGCVCACLCMLGVLGCWGGMYTQGVGSLDHSQAVPTSSIQSLTVCKYGGGRPGRLVMSRYVRGVMPDEDF